MTWLVRLERFSRTRQSDPAYADRTVIFDRSMVCEFDSRFAMPQLFDDACDKITGTDIRE